jgi:hypothetical protein
MPRAAITDTIDARPIVKKLSAKIFRDYLRRDVFDMNAMVASAEVVEIPVSIGV